MGRTGNIESVVKGMERAEKTVHNSISPLRPNPKGQK